MARTLKSAKNLRLKMNPNLFRNYGIDLIFWILVINIIFSITNKKETNYGVFVF